MRRLNVALLVIIGAAFASAEACSSKNDDSGSAGGSGGGGKSGGAGGGAKAGSGGSGGKGGSGGAAGGSGGGSGGAGGDDFGFAGASGGGGGGGATANKDAGAMDAAPPYVGTLFDFENGLTTGWTDARAGGAKFAIDTAQAHGGAKSLRIDINYDTSMNTSKTEWFPGWPGGALNHSKNGIPCWVERPLTAWIRVSPNWPVNIFQAVFHDNAFAWESNNVFVNAKEQWFKVSWKMLDPAMMPIRDNDNGFLQVGFYVNGIVNPSGEPDGGLPADAGPGMKTTYSLWVDDVACE
jgi:hypothetical protein